MKFYLIAVSGEAKKRGNFTLNLSKAVNVGRGRFNKINLPSPLCSKLHCTIYLDDSKIVLEDKVGGLLLEISHRKFTRKVVGTIVFFYKFYRAEMALGLMI